MSLSHFDPLANLRLFEDAFTRLISEPQSNRPWSPAVDIYETENDLVIKADLPDVDQNDIDVRVENQTLTIRASANSKTGIRHRLSPDRAQLWHLPAQLRRAQYLRYRENQRRLQKRRPDRLARQEGSRQTAPGESRSPGVRTNFTVHASNKQHIGLGPPRPELSLR